MEVNDFLGSDEAAQAIFTAVDSAVTARCAPTDRRVSKSQIGFYRNHPFAAVWRPAQYLGGNRPPLVLSVFLRRRDPSPRWKEVVEPAPGRFSHHLELFVPGEVDDEVAAWLEEAWASAA